MQRFLKNPWFAFVLTLSLSMGTVAMLSSSAMASSNPSQSVEDPTTGGGGGTPTGYGDPDAPSSSAKRSMLNGGSVGTLSPAGVGDDSGLQSVWMWRLRIVLQALRSSWIHP